MLRNKKIIFIPLICLFTLLLFSQNIQFIKADSGFDSSYDSGSSWDSSSNYSSSSSFDSSYSSSSSGGTYSSTSFPMGVAIFMELFCSIHYFVFAFQPIGRVFGHGDSKKSMIIALILFGIRALILVIADILVGPMYSLIDFVLLFLCAFMIVPIFSVLFKSNTKNSSVKNLKLNYNDLNDDILSKYGINDKEDLKQKLFENYLAIQNAWMNFDEHSLRLLLTDELYNMYLGQLETLRAKGQRNIMKDFKYINSKLFDIRQENDVLTVKLFLNVAMYDYIVDNIGNVVRGSKNRPIDISYEITFEKSLSKGKDYCPNCGAKVIDENNPRCPYCNAVILNGSNDWVMSKKECVNQK